MPFEDVHGNGGLLTTVGDLLRWNRNFADLKLGGRALLEQQQQRGRLSDGKTIAYASGLMMLTWTGLPEVSHSGSTAGYRAWLARYPEQGLSVAVLCNAASANATQLGHEVADVFLGDAVRLLSADPAVVLNAAALAAKAGMYRSTRDHSVIVLSASSGQLRMGAQVLKPVGPNVVARADGGRGEFEVDSSGKVIRLRTSSSLDPDHVHEKVEPANPTRGDLEALAGEYVSDEAEVTFGVALAGDRLVIHRRPNATYPLTPTYRDGFASPLGSVRFMRDAAGKVTGLSVGESRVWDLRFRRRTAP